VPAHVLVYTTPWCPYCHAAKRLLGTKQASFTEVDVDDRPDLRSWLASASGQRTVPQVFINGHPVGGYDDIEALDEEGQLDRLLAEPPPADLVALPD
jgi:glutaredoxin 3